MVSPSPGLVLALVDLWSSPSPSPSPGLVLALVYLWSSLSPGPTLVYSYPWSTPRPGLAPPPHPSLLPPRPNLIPSTLTLP